jgi:3-oxoacyl-(acyl-carrier-protein) synthase
LQNIISITGLQSISSLGTSQDEIWKNYKKGRPAFTKKFDTLVASISKNAKQEISELRTSDEKYKALDNSVLYAMYAARKSVNQAKWSPDDNFGINIGSSRGATHLFESYHKDFLANNKAGVLSSPTTTLGNISSWIAHDLQTKGPEISHSITCSTALHAVLNGVAWINSGMCDKFLTGGSEAPLTEFTIAQMQALRIYTTDTSDYPCRALDLHKNQNTMLLGEGASMACLEKGHAKNALAIIAGIGYASEILEHNASLSTNAICFQRSMKMALASIHPDDVDIIITHTPGTMKGDLSEILAIESVFNNQIPALTSNKWLLGHTLGASGMLNIEMAILMLKHQEFISIPYIENKLPKHIKTILVNAVGFGGNAVSILLKKA